jgi:hypothetical protein
MPAGYAATTGVESIYGDKFKFEISDLRIAERLPATAGLPLDVRVMPGGAPSFPAASTRPPSNIVPIDISGPVPGTDVFYLGLDVTFVGTDLGGPSMPDTVDLEVRFYLEGYGHAPVGAGNPPERHEINIAPQVFAGLEATPGAGVSLRHQLWVEVFEGNLAAIIESPDPAVEPWDELFTPDTIYRIAASVKVVGATYHDPSPLTGLGYIDGAVMSTIAAS